MTACHGTLQPSLHSSVQWFATGDHFQHSTWSSKAQTVSTKPAAFCRTTQLWSRRGPLSPCMSLSYSRSQSNTVQLDRNVCRSSGIAGNRAPYGSLGSTASPAVPHSQPEHSTLTESRLIRWLRLVGCLRYLIERLVAKSPSTAGVPWTSSCCQGNVIQ